MNMKYIGIAKRPRVRHLSALSATSAFRTLFLLLAAAGIARAQDLGIKAPSQTQPVAIINAAIHPVSGPTIDRGYVLFREGKIESVGGTPPSFAKDVRVIDATGKHIYPGMVGAYSQIGLEEIGAVRASTDISEVGSAGIMPEVCAHVSVNPDSTLIPVTRSNGVLAVGVFPKGGVISGRASVIQLDGWTSDDMTVLPEAGLSVNWPQSRPVTAWWMDRSEEDQLKDIRLNMQRIEEAFAQAEAYARARAADPNTPIDIRWEAMRRVFPRAPKPDERGVKKAAQLEQGQVPVFILAQDYDQIAAAVGFTTKHGLKCVIVGGREAPLCADLLKRHSVPVVVLGTLKMPRRDDSAYDEAYTLPARLEAAGVKWCLASGEETPHERNLPYSAAMAVTHGLGMDAAIRSVTLSAAEVLGVGPMLGSLEPGKRATLLVTDGNPLAIDTKIDSAFIDGKQIDLGNKQTELEKKYREKYRQEREAAKRNGAGSGGPAAK